MAWSTTEIFVDVTGSADGTRVWTVGEKSIWFSSDAGLTWTPRTNPDKASNRILRGIFTTPDATELWATAGAYVARSNDQGETWSTVAVGDTEDDSPDILFTPLRDVHGSADGTRLFVAGASPYLSTDAGRTWSRVAREEDADQPRSIMSIHSDIDGKTCGLPNPKETSYA